MNILLALVPISLILLGLAIYAFVWAVRNGQYDDLDTPALDILTEDRNERAESGQTDDDRTSVHMRGCVAEQKRIRDGAQDDA